MKTRLGAQIGKSNAREFYTLCAAAVKEVVWQVQKEASTTVVPYWAVAEIEALKNPLWSDFKSIWTGEGGLGERISHVFEELHTMYDNVIIIGSDSPQITPAYILQAIEALKQNSLDGIIGPCRDGGFVLFGSKWRIYQKVWMAVEYSREDTLRQLTDKLKKMGYQYDLLSEQGDVDTYEDLKDLLKSFWVIGKDILPRQQELFYWVKNLINP